MVFLRFFGIFRRGRVRVFLKSIVFRNLMRGQFFTGNKKSNNLQRFLKKVRRHTKTGANFEK
ncbi:MAG: hypothetical protein A2Y12_06695 [Planctomycetes bacterium GWF2_42_9]|nr:MAG: hypothetical protein A2Y12_06695 [Planctomycetes bacterium GWF2_42_9]